MVDRASVVALAVVSTCFFWRSFTLVSVQTEFHLDFTSFEFSCSFGEFHSCSMDIGDDIWEEGANLSSADGDDWTVVEGEVVNLDRSSKSQSHRLTPQCKSQPLAAPQYRCDLATSRMDHRGRTVPPVGGLARPSQPQRPQQDSIFYAVGLPVPMCQVAIPRSLQIPDCADDVTVAEHVHDVQSYALPSSGKRQRRQSKIPVQSDTGPIDLVRTKRASDSPLVQSLWDMIINLYVLHSPLLQQIQHSAFRREHFARLIDNFAASTLVKYLSALQVFHSLLTDMRIHLAGLSELQLADILVAGRLSKHSEGATASPSILIKAVRWGFKQLQIEPFSVAFGPLIASFQMKVPKDRRESLPFSLYILTQFERHILVRETSREDVLILGSYMLLLFSGLRFADMQRTAPSSLQWDGTSLRGLAWRTKTSCAGTPLGALACGFLSQGSYNWLFKFLVHLDGVLAEAGIAEIDFLVPSIGPEGIRAPLRPMSYAESLFFLRHFLRLPWKKSPLDLGIAPQSYTIHGLKSTLISWATQLDLPDEHKRLQGKHQSRNSSTRLYSRDMEIANGAIGMNALRQMFETHSFAMVMAEVAHLSSWKMYYLKFLSLMTHRYDPDTGLRGPTILEAQAADKALTNVAIDLVTERSWSWDDALYEITHIRADITSLLQPRPKLPKATSAPRSEVSSGKGNFQSARPGPYSKGQGKQGKAKGKSKVQWLTETTVKGERKQLCMRFQTGKCTLGDACKFHHGCAYPMGDGACNKAHGALIHEKTPH